MRYYNVYVILRICIEHIPYATGLQWSDMHFFFSCTPLCHDINFITLYDCMVLMGN
jgi:hypothetical protein